MAHIQGLTQAQNRAVANVSVGSLILLYNPCYERPESDIESEDDDDEEGEDEDDENDEDEDEGEDEEEDEEEDDDEDGDGDEDEGEHEDDVDRAEHIEDASLSEPVTNGNSKARSPLLFIARNVSVVTGVTKDPNGIITDIHIIGLEYKSRPDDGTRSYQLYGNQCVANLPSTPSTPTLGSTGYELKFYTKGVPLSLFQNMAEQTFTVAPTGDHVRRLLHSGRCPARCVQGFIVSIDQLHGLVKDYTVPTSNTDMHAVCPACVGVDLMKEHQGLRVEIETSLQVASFSALLDFQARLAPRRAQLGYAYMQFDEHEWNLLFDDMTYEDGEDGSEGGFEPWDEANDPNGDVVPCPAPQATIDSLQISEYATIKVDDDAQCTVCCEQFKDEQLVVKLPCKHIFCEGACILEWLKNNDSCPLCRAQVSSEADNKAADNANGDEEMSSAVEELEKDHPATLRPAMPGAYEPW
jgi:hypothetical protein